MVNPYLSANSLYSLLINWVLLSEMISSGVPSTEKQKLRAEIIFLRRNARHLLYIRKFAVVISNQKVVFVTLDKYVHT